MVEPGSSGEFSLALVNAVLLALWPVLPALLLGYVRQALAARHVRPQFSLRKSELLELDRAVRMYEQVCHRLARVEPRSGRANGLWRSLFHPRAPIDQDGDREDLLAHAQLLRETIVRLKCRPLQRLTSWVRLISSKSALGRGVAAYVVGFALVLGVFHGPEQSAWADELTTGASNALTWYPFDERFFYANAAAAGFAAAAAALFYPVRWIGLCREYACEYCKFRELARSDPGQPIDQMHVEAAERDFAQPADSVEADFDRTWFAVFGLPPSATVEDIKAAYRRLIKQNHPDRVHGMSPAFRKLAEAETQRLNAAFSQALISVSRPGAATD